MDRINFGKDREADSLAKYAKDAKDEKTSKVKPRKDTEEPQILSQRREVRKGWEE